MRLIDCIIAYLKNNQEIRGQFVKMIQEHNAKFRVHIVRQHEEPPKKRQKGDKYVPPKEQIDFYKEMEAAAKKLFEGTTSPTAERLCNLDL